MGRDSGRRRYVPINDKRDANGFGVSDVLQSVKRRKLSTDEADSTVTQQDGHHSDDHSDRHNEWQTVPSKSSRRKQKPGQRSSNHQRSYPSLSFSHKITRPLMIEQLRDLALYVLADGVGPDWVAVNNARGINKVVVMMVPGFDQEVLKRTKVLMQDLRNDAGREGKPPAAQEDEKENQNDTKDTDGEIAADNCSFTPAVDANQASSTLKDPNISNDLALRYSSDWLLNDSIPVKAPGDSKYSKVHSPLQAILMTPAADGPEKKNNKTSGEKHFKAVVTPITHFIHTADELREAEYPIHPATFTSAADAALEASRRESTGQSITAGWVDSVVEENGPLIPASSLASPRDHLSQGLSIYSIDCEMVLTSDQKSSLARISVVSWPTGKVVLDKYVKPELTIENYFTQFSGITPKILENVTTTLADIQQELLKILTPSTVLLGHSLESDLNALKVTHPFLIDTSMLYPHPRGLPLRSSLKFLANKYLKREIQTGGANGHDSVEDARAVLDLVRLKCEKGPKFGTTEANGETIFKRLSRNKRKDGKELTSAIVEYGSSPERGLGKDATYAIGCQNDDDIVAGMIRAIKGDEDGKEIPAGGTDFIWGRLRALEFARGWVTNNNASANGSIAAPNVVEDSNSSEPPKSATTSVSQEDINRSTLETLEKICQIREALPPTTLFIIYSGVSDVRPVLRLQAIQLQYRKEFKVKKWDELSVRWTDVEEQALRNAAEKARSGWGWIGVV